MSSRDHRTQVKLAALAVGLLAASLLWSGSTLSAFDQRSSMPGNSVTAGTVALSDNDDGTAALTLSGAQPGDGTSGCVIVRHAGTTAATVRLYGTVGGTGLAEHLTLTVTRGTIGGTPAPGSCTGFAADTTSWRGLGAGVLYEGSLAAFPTSTGTALADPVTAAPTEWTDGEEHAYRLQVTLPSGTSAAAQGLTAKLAFTWQAVSR
jgi:hypothetical protein